MNSFEYGFFDAFEKLAATAYVKLLKQYADAGDTESFNRLSKQLSEAMASGKIRSRESTIKSLGEGRSNVVDLVHNPVIGGAARKIGVSSDDTAELGRHLGEHRYKSFAAKLGDRPEISGYDVNYWEPVFGKGPAVSLAPHLRPRTAPEAVAAYNSAAAREKIAREKLKELRAKLKTEPKSSPLYQQLSNQYDDLQSRQQTLSRMATMYSEIFQSQVDRTKIPNLDSDSAKIQNKLKGRLWDLRPANIVNNKVVDAEFHKDTSSYPPVTSRVPPADVKGNARRKLLHSVINSEKSSVVPTPLASPHGVHKLQAVPERARELPPVPERSQKAPEKPNMRVLKALGIGAGILGVGYGGYKLYKYLKNKNKKKDGASKELASKRR